MIDQSSERIEREEGRTDESENKVVCPICGAAAVQEKCKLVCRSEICRGRVVMNCSEF
jgi:hypothetical protein